MAFVSLLLEKAWNQSEPIQAVFAKEAGGPGQRQGTFRLTLYGQGDKASERTACSRESHVLTAKLELPVQ